MATKSKVDGSREKTGGRAKGTPNVATKELKQMILNALDRSGGEDYLMKQAEDNPNAFLTLIGKVLPTTLAGDPSAPLTIEGITVNFTNASKLTK